MTPASVTHRLLKMIFSGLYRCVSWLCVAVVGDWTLSFLDMEDVGLNTTISIQESMVPRWHGCCWQDPFQRIRHLGQPGQPKGMRSAPSRPHCIRFRDFSLSEIPDLLSRSTSANFTHMRSWTPSLLSVCSKGRFLPHQHLDLNFLSCLMIAPAWNWWPSLIIWTHTSARLWVALCILLLPTAGQEFALACRLDM